jgi:Arf-GAP with GTPase, ANK repeat and PH domain-containing protein 1/3/4/5/6/9/11
MTTSNGAHDNNTKQPIHYIKNNGIFIRKEIQRFESVHPNIYSIYDLIDSISDFNLQQQIREHIVNIEDSFVNSQEWTLGRNVADLKLGILGSVNSGKSSLVHRFLTGTYIQEESPEGGRFKKEVIIDGQSYLLLIRDESGEPEMQFTHWCDAVIFVFSLDNEESLKTAQEFYLKMQNYRHMSEIPFILVGTQDSISETSPRLIEEHRARSVLNEFKKCSYFETCATYGLNVERVFHDSCQKIVNLRTQLLFNMANISSANQHSPSTSNLHLNNIQKDQNQTSIRNLAGSHVNSSSTSTAPSTVVASSASASAGLNGNGHRQPLSPTQTQTALFFQANPHLINSTALHSANQLSSSCFKEPLSIVNKLQSSTGSKLVFEPASARDQKDFFLQPDKVEITTPTSINGSVTPNQKRKESNSNNRRRSNIFTPNKKSNEEKEKLKNGLTDMGIGRSIPLKQGFLYKKTNSTINKDWKKKFVTLNDDGSLKYYPSMNDYMDDSHGKEIDLQKTTIKIPGAMKPRSVNKPSIISTNSDDIETNNGNVEVNKLPSLDELKPQLHIQPTSNYFFVKLLTHFILN